MPNIEKSDFTHDQAKKMMAEIVATAENVAGMVVKFHAGRGWLALGYSTWRECAEAELPHISFRHVQRIVSAEKTGKLLEDDDVKMGGRPFGRPVQLENFKQESQERPIGRPVKVEEVKPVLREGVTRELASVDPADVPIVMKAAQKKAENGKVTAAVVRQAVAEHVQAKRKMSEAAVRALASEDFKVLQSQIQAIRKRIKELSAEPHGKHLADSTLTECDSNLKTVWQILKFAAPENVCPYCAIGTKHCAACDGTGWVSLLTWNSAPEDMRLMVEKLA